MLMHILFLDNNAAPWHRWFSISGFDYTSKICVSKINSCQMDYMIFHHSILNTNTFCLTKYKEGTVLSSLARLTVGRILVDFGMTVSQTGKEFIFFLV